MQNKDVWAQFWGFEKTRIAAEGDVENVVAGNWLHTKTATLLGRCDKVHFVV